MPNSARDLYTEGNEPGTGHQRETTILTEPMFHRAIVMERRRTERSEKPFLLMLVDAGRCTSSQKRSKVLSGILRLLVLSTRETDAVGWYKKDLIVGALFTEIDAENKPSILAATAARMSAVLRSQLNIEQLSQLTISFHLFPEDYDHQAGERTGDPTLYPDVPKYESSRRVPRMFKRSVDVLVAILAFLILSPVFLLIALAIKLNSKGPILFRQKRVGQYGALFTFLKFRSMYVESDPSIHREYMRRLIAGEARRQPSNGKGEDVYKLTDDDRITRVGAFLRRSSLDELPQLLNVLWGEMSLVGPRPALPYEVAEYDLWHRRRLLEVKPGITGLWQVSGRNRISFDEMVRLDLMYAKTWSLWVDAKILLRTPRAVLEGAH